MSKKTLIGSIIAVTILIGVSFTSVVGYNSVEYDLKISPLFKMRTSKATEKESKDLHCDYIGKDEEGLFFPNKNHNLTTLEKTIDMICKMDDETYHRFIALFVSQLQYDNEVDSISVEKVVTLFDMIRNNNKFGNTLLQMKNSLLSPNVPSYNPTSCPFYVTCGGPIWCMFVKIISTILVIWYIFRFLIVLISSRLRTVEPGCLN